MHPSVPMPDEIKAGFSPDFERGWRRVESVGRALMLLALAATLGGFLGGGPVSLWTRTVGAGDLRVEYAPIVRFGTPTSLTLRAAAAPGQDKVAVTLPSDIVADYGLRSVFPQPLEWAAGERDIRLVFPVRPGAREATVQIGGMPAVEGGWVRLSARLDDGPAVSWSQVSLP